MEPTSSIVASGPGDVLVLSLVLLTHAMHSCSVFGWCLEQVVIVEVNTVFSEIAVMWYKG